MEVPDGYLDRVDVERSATLAELHRAHVTHILFENLDPYRGRPVSLDPEAIAEKLIDRGRGGYCFEHNLLFARVLEARGSRVEHILARVRNGGPASPASALTHLLLRAEVGGKLWHMDVGFGQGTLLEPIPFGPGGPYEQSGWRFQVVVDGTELVLQTETETGWRDLYAFRPEPVPEIDIKLSNWYTCTHPDSRFVRSLLVTAHATDGSRTTLSDFGGEPTLTVQTPTGLAQEPVARERVDQLLAERFGLIG